MAGVLSNCGAWNVDSVISFLIVASCELCDKIYELLQKSYHNRGYKISVHKCESIADVLRYKPDLHVDFVICAFDSRIRENVEEVEKSIQMLDEFFIISGRVCLINYYGSTSMLKDVSHFANNLRHKYCLRLLSADVNSLESSENLGNRILNLAEALLGIKSGVPDLNLLSVL